MAETAGGRRGAAALWRSLRPHHWTKNLLLLAAAVFSGTATNPDVLGRALAATAVFCLLASAVYLVNDLVDREADRLHPRKRQRPLAAGDLAPATAGVAASLLGLVGVAGAAALGGRFLFVAGVYVALALGYCFGLKRVVVLDVIVLASGYTLRAIAGAEAVAVAISGWLVICTSALALFLGFCKRRHELATLEAAGAGAHRAVLVRYSLPFLDQMIAVAAAASLLSYVLYTFDPAVVRRAGPWMAATAVFVVYGIFRYLHLLHLGRAGGAPPRDLLEDRPLLFTAILYATAVVAILYLQRA